jgi:hypothetical protein
MNFHFSPDGNVIGTEIPRTTLTKRQLRKVDRWLGSPGQKSCKEFTKFFNCIHLRLEDWEVCLLEVVKKELYRRMEVIERRLFLKKYGY